MKSLYKQAHKYFYFNRGPNVVVLNNKKPAYSYHLTAMDPATATVVTATDTVVTVTMVDTVATVTATDTGCL